jgi:hypothetical protein
MLTAMAYSDETMKRMEASIANAGNALLGVGAAAEDAVEAMSGLQEFADSCCGLCESDCYVDGMTGA